VTDLLDHLLAQKGSEDNAPLGRTGGAEPAALAGKRKEILAQTRIAIDAGKTSGKITTIEKGPRDRIEESPL
jgi:hypothetical protein